MKLALLGADANTLAIATAIAARRQDKLLVVCEFDGNPFARPLSQRGLLAPELHDWDTLLDAGYVDAVIVAHSADEDRRAEQLRKFAQAAVPVLASHPLFSSMLVYYELDMICRDTHGLMLPYLPERWHPAIVELARLCQPQSDGPIGELEQLVFERHLVDRDKTAIRGQFARDVDLLRAIGGDVARIHAMGPAAGSTSYGNLTVQMSGASSLLVRWSVAPAEDHPTGRLTLVGSAGRAVVTMPGETAAASAPAWGFELSVAGSRLERQLSKDWNPADAALDGLAEALGGRSIKPDLLDAARSAELTETIDRSLKRGRTIELHYEEYSEASTFKGTMAAVGCSLLMVGLVLVVVVGVLEDFLRRRVPLIPKWPYVLLGVLGLFLALQFLLLAIRRSPAQAGKPAGDLSGGDDPAD
jgi:myo-inositol 2-dehydrogenase/D-chiro-inositol 1-dehydrogenase